MTCGIVNLFLLFLKPPDSLLITSQHFKMLSPTGSFSSGTGTSYSGIQLVQPGTPAGQMLVMPSPASPALQYPGTPVFMQQQQGSVFLVPAHTQQQTEPQHMTQMAPQQLVMQQLVLPQHIRQMEPTFEHPAILSPGQYSATTIASEEGVDVPPQLLEESEVADDSSTAPLRVSGRTKISALAGAIAKRLRLKLFVAVEAMGAESVATTTIALALAKSFISPANLTLLVQIESISAPPREPTSPKENDHPGLRFVARAWKHRESPAPDTNNFDLVLRIPEDSAVAKVAGSIAKLMRGPGVLGKTVGLRPSPGAASLNITSKTIALSRAMLNGDGFDIYCRPCFENDVQKSLNQDTEVSIALYLTRKNDYQ